MCNIVLCLWTVYVSKCALKFNMTETNHETQFTIFFSLFQSKPISEIFCVILHTTHVLVHLNEIRYFHYIQCNLNMLQYANAIKILTAIDHNVWGKIYGSLFTKYLKKLIHFSWEKMFFCIRISYVQIYLCLVQYKYAKICIKIFLFIGYNSSRKFCASI